MNMKKSFRRYLSLAMASLLLSCSFLQGCTSESEITESPDDSVPAITEEQPSDDTDLPDSEKEPKTDVPVEDEKVEESEKTEEDIPPVESVFFNPLTGLACDEVFVTKRPVAMMINNIKQAIPQLGISKADIMYECIVEGGITRLMCVFSDYENLPVTGSVRSSRDYYIDLAQSHDAIYAHCGGSEDAYSAIAERHIDNIDGVRGSQYEASAYWKDSERVNNMGYEHASMTSGDKIAGAVKALNFRTTLTDGFSHPLNFRKDKLYFAGTEAVSVTISYSGSYSRSFFAYDEESEKYKKGQYGAPHVDAENSEILSFDNIIVLGVSYQNTGDSYNHLVMNFTGSGKGYYISNGKMKNIVWTKSDRQTPYSLYEEDGVTPLLINPGKTYIGLANGLSQVKISATADYTIE